MGLLVGCLVVVELLGCDVLKILYIIVMGVLVMYIIGGVDVKMFQLMNVNFGLFLFVDGVKGGCCGCKDCYKVYIDCVKVDF